MLYFTAIQGLASEPKIAECLHDLGHKGAVELLEIEPEDMHRRRLRATTTHGTECAISLPRSEKLENGSVLLLDDERAIVVQMNEQQWLVLKANDISIALELAYFAGNMHWQVKIDGPKISVALLGQREDYMKRLTYFFENGRVENVTDG